MHCASDILLTSLEFEPQSRNYVAVDDALTSDDRWTFQIMAWHSMIRRLKLGEIYHLDGIVLTHPEALFHSSTPQNDA